MSEELRIVVTDQGAAGDSARAPLAPPVSRAPSAGAESPTGGQQVAPPASRVPSVRKTPPPFLVAPPVQADIQRAKEAKQAAARVAETRRRHVGATAQIYGGALIGEALASGQAGQAAGQLLRAGAKVLTSPVGITIAAFTAAVGVAVVAMRSFSKAVQAQVENLSGVSAEVALAQARTDLRREFGRIRRGERIGADLAHVEDLRSRLETKIAGIQTEILGVLLKLARRMEPAIEGVIFIAEKTAPAVAAGGEAAVKHLPLLAGAAPGLAAIIKLLGIIGENTEKEEDDVGPDPFFEQFMGHVPNTPPFWPRGQQLPRGRGLAGQPGV